MKRSVAVFAFGYGAICYTFGYDVEFPIAEAAENSFKPETFKPETMDDLLKGRDGDEPSIDIDIKPEESERFAAGILRFTGGMLILGGHLLIELANEIDEKHKD